MRPLIDGDILLYELGFAAETGWKKGEGDPPPFDYVQELLVNRINNICRQVDADVPPTIYFTGKKNFRTEIAKLRQYKERNGVKPFHYYNIKTYLQCMYDTLTIEGLEADDLMAIEQTRCNDLHYSERTIICSRDKDLRQVPGLQYGWEVGKQPSFGPFLVDEFGKIEVVEQGAQKQKKLKGYGSLFFYGQCITGDGVDTVPGLPNYGPVKALKLLSGAITTRQAYEATLEAYKTVYGDAGEANLTEQAQLLWMVRKLNEDGSPVMWSPPDE